MTDPEHTYRAVDELALLRGTHLPQTVADEDRAAAVIRIITALAESHTRGEGFTDGVPAPDIAAAVATASARLIAYSDQLPKSETMGAFSVDYPQGGFAKWSLVERAVLDRYRRRAL